MSTPQTMSDETLTIDAIDARRKDMDISQGDLAEHLANSDGYDLAGSTLSGRISDWKNEEHDREPEPSDLQRLNSILDTIEEKRNTSYPDCTRCGRECLHEPDIIDGEPYCIVCGDWHGIRGGVVTDDI